MKKKEDTSKKWGRLKKESKNFDTIFIDRKINILLPFEQTMSTQVYFLLIYLISSSKIHFGTFLCLALFFWFGTFFWKKGEGGGTVLHAL